MKFSALRHKLPRHQALAQRVRCASDGILRHYKNRLDAGPALLGNTWVDGTRQIFGDRDFQHVK